MPAQESSLAHPSRRALLQRLAAWSAAAALAPAGARAQTASDYKALVCFFLFGGNDGHNTVVPIDAAPYAAYKALRGGLSLPDGNTALLPVTTPAGVRLGLNSGLSAIAPYWVQGKLAVVGNVGMLARPTTRAQILGGTALLPTNLYSHSDQVAQMQAADPNGSGGTGWAGRSLDEVRSRNGSSRFPAAISLNGSALFCAAATAASASLLPGFDLTPNGLSAWPASAAAIKARALDEVLTMDSGLSMVHAANLVRQDAVQLNKLLTAGGAGTSPAGFPGTPLGQQLQQVARIIGLRATTGIARQVFFCSLGGFDTHSGQSWQQWDLLRQVAEGMAALQGWAEAQGVAGQVTMFTESDFGRTLQPSGTGSDHGWGSHHWVLGGAVRGGQIYGTIPMPALAGPDDASSRGALIPGVALDQYAATLARWFGVDAGGLARVFPNLVHFPQADLGFMG
jgi:uncharacterized protein (DUF1501 family)